MHSFRRKKLDTGLGFCLRHALPKGLRNAIGLLRPDQGLCREPVEHFGLPEGTFA